jgi:hypothetical protein
MFNILAKRKSFYDSLIDKPMKAKTLDEQQDAILNLLCEWKCFPDSFNLKEHMQDKNRAAHIRYHVANAIMRKIEQSSNLLITNTDAVNLKTCKEVVNYYIKYIPLYKANDYDVRVSTGDDDNTPHNFRPRPGSF